jgi:hypothetical protein
LPPRLTAPSSSHEMEPPETPGRFRWSVALALGLRQGEALGLHWQYVDLDVGTLTVRWQLQRFGWRHGCLDPPSCAKNRHSGSCLARCTRHARSCPQRTGAGLQLTELKSDKSRRTIAIPPQLAAALKVHRTAQLQERMAAGSVWHDGDFVWCQPNGRPIGASGDWDEWSAFAQRGTCPPGESSRRQAHSGNAPPCSRR